MKYLPMEMNLSSVVATALSDMRMGKAGGNGTHLGARLRRLAWACPAVLSAVTMSSYFRLRGAGIVFVESVGAAAGPEGGGALEVIVVGRKGG